MVAVWVLTSGTRRLNLNRGCVAARLVRRGSTAHLDTASGGAGRAVAPAAAPDPKKRRRRVQGTLAPASDDVTLMVAGSALGPGLRPDLVPVRQLATDTEPVVLIG